MKIIPEALSLAKLQRTSMNEKQIINSYDADFENVIDNCRCGKDFKILDIGCGIAGWECFLEHDEKIYLIDKTKVDKIYYGFKEKASFYNSMEIAKKNLIANGIKEENIDLQEATETNDILFNEEFDLIVSFISCGFHYPVETYLDKIYEKLKIGGVLIIDVRKNTSGDSLIKKKFGNLEAIKEENKYLRVKAVKELETLNIKSSGNVGMETTNPKTKLEVFSKGQIGMDGNHDPNENLEIQGV